MSSSLVIITGGSKGIGLALCKHFLEKGFTVYSLARSKNEIINKNLRQISVNLSDSEKIEQIVVPLFKNLSTQKWKQVIFIQNAGRLGNINYINNLDTKDIKKSINLNYTSPVLMSKCFINHFEKSNQPKKIIFIGSGAASNPYDGWSVYCSTKAALEKFAETIASEQTKKNNGFQIFVIRPGVVETAMQEQIRKCSENEFAQKEKFVHLFQNNELFTSDKVAKLLFNYVIDNEKKGFQFVDLRSINH